MKKFNLFLVALSCAVLSFVGCSNPSSSSSSNFSHDMPQSNVDFSKELPEWITGTWDLTGYNKSSCTPESDFFPSGEDTTPVGLYYKFYGNKDSDQCDAYSNMRTITDKNGNPKEEIFKSNDITTVSDWRNERNWSASTSIAAEFEGLENIKYQYSHYVNDAKDELTIACEVTGSFVDYEGVQHSVSFYSKEVLKKRK